MQQKNLQNEKQQIGRWTKEEHQRFMYAIMQYGKDWKKVEQYVRTRSGSQVRSHAQKFFNKLQKMNHNQEPAQRSHQEFSETDFDVERQFNNQVSTPLELVSLINRQSREEGGRVNLQGFRNKLQERNQQLTKQEEQQQMPQGLARQNSYKSMSNILSAYQELAEEKKEKKDQDAGFLILLTKKYKGMFGRIQDFGKLVDINNGPVPFQGERKRSFTLPEGNDLSGDELDQKIEEIKKLINTEPDKKTKTLIIQGQDEDKGQVTAEGVSNQKGVDLNEQMPNLNRLSTIQQQPKEDDDVNSHKPSVSEEDKNAKKKKEK